MQELSPLRAESAKQIAAQRGLRKSRSLHPAVAFAPAPVGMTKFSRSTGQSFVGTPVVGERRAMCYDLLLGIYQLSEGPILEEMTYA
jgi:hypothetical protein